MSANAEGQAARDGGRTFLAWVILALTVLEVVAGILVSVLDALRSTGEGWPKSGPLSSSELPYVIAFLAVPIVGYAVASRRPDNPIGWLLSGVGWAFGLDRFLAAYTSYAFNGGFGGPRLALLAAALYSPSWVAIVGPTLTFLILIFPDGHLPSPRWRWFARVLGAYLTLLFLAILFSPGPLENSVIPGENPLGIESLGPALQYTPVLIILLPLGIVGSLISLLQRFHRSTGLERHQLRLLVAAAGILAVLFVPAIPIGLAYGWTGSTRPGWVQVFQAGGTAAFALIPVAIGVAVLRYRLFEIDVVINRALLFGALAIFITAVYIGIVVGLGALVGSRANPVLSAVAAAVVALAFHPVRRRAQRLADRLVYGERATPYEVLSAFSEQVVNTYAIGELLPTMARALADGTGAARADVWLRLGDHLRPEARWPQEAEPAAAIPLEASAGWATATATFEPVRHHGELLGALSIRKKPGEAITPTEEKLVRDLAAQAGLVMQNVALTESLMENVEELRASRKRLVTAQDEERRRLERNLHDGAQQQFVALSVKLGLLEKLIDRDPEKAKVTAAGLQSEASAALEELRGLAHGIYPPLLADKGLVAALDSQARRLVVPVTIQAEAVGRYPREVEAAVYFSCLEALQNVSKYAKASRVTVRLSQSDDRLRFEVVDDGVGFKVDEVSYGTGLQGIADRLSAIGGELRIRSAPGAGTSVTGEVPVAQPP